MVTTTVEHTTERAKGRNPWGLLAAIAGLAAGGVGAAITAISAYVGYRSVHPSRSFGRGEPPDGSYRSVQFLSTDGLRLSGWYLPAAAPSVGIVLCHGFQTGRREMLPLAVALRAKGYSVLTFDFRAHGESQGRWTSCGLLETRDLEGAARYLLSRAEVTGDRVGVVGFSMGAAVSILTAARAPTIGAVVADSAFATLKDVVAAGFRIMWGFPPFPFASLSLWFAERLVGVKAESIRPMDAIADLAPRPLLIVHGTADRLVPVADAHLLYESAQEPKELWTVPGADHVQARELDPAGYVDRVDSFFTKALARREEGGPPSTTDLDSSRS